MKSPKRYFSVTVPHGAPKSLITTAEVAKYFGWPQKHVAARRTLGLGPKPVLVGRAHYYPFQDSEEWRDLWFDRSATRKSAPTLSPIRETLYQNAQWLITEDGIEPKDDPGYLVEPGRLGEMIEHWHYGTIYEWPYHMAAKNWVDLERFIDAFLWALDCFRGQYGPEPTDQIIVASLKAARHEHLTGRNA